MNDQPGNPIIVELLKRVGRENSRIAARLDAWIETMDRLGYPIARKASLDVYRLNKHAMEDLGTTDETLNDLSCLGDRMVILYNTVLCIWKPLAKGPKIKIDGLSKREQQVWEWLNAGKTAEETGIILNISKRTVEKHRQNVYRKLRLSLVLCHLKWHAARESNP